MISTNTETRMRFMEIVSNRIASSYDCEGQTMPSQLAGLVHNSCGISKEAMSAFLWGESSPELSEEEIKLIIKEFDFQRELFQIAIRKSDQPVSKEIITHILETVAYNNLEPAECQGCAQLETLILDSNIAGYSMQELNHLVLDSLDHIIDIQDETCGHEEIMMTPAISVPPPPEDEVVELKDWFDDPIDSGNDLAPALLAVFEKLNREQQLDLLALACKKLHTSVEDRKDLSELKYLRLLRSRYLTPLARSVFDQLVSGPKIGFGCSDLIANLKLNNRRSLGQLERSVENSIRKLNADHLEANITNPLKTVSRGKEKHYILDSNVKDDWKVILEVEEASDVILAK